MKTLLAALLLLLVSGCRSTDRPMPLIFDTDCGPDYDDVGAMAVMYTLQSEGKCEVLAVMSSNKQELVVPTVDVLNTYYGHPDMPVGELKTDGVNIPGWHKQSWAQFLVDKYKPRKQSGASTPDAVTLYRKLLAQAPDHSVVICTVGFLTNLANLLASQPDEYSPLMGKELVAFKVNRVVTMGGGFPTGHEFNIKEDAAASDIVAREWPTPIYFCGFEVGEKVITGKATSEMAVENNPVADAYRVALSQDNPAGRNSWDQVTVLAAINGTEPYFTLCRGTFLVTPDGKNSWQDDPQGRHYYMIPKVGYAHLAAEIERLMMTPPRR